MPFISLSPLTSNKVANSNSKFPYGLVATISTLVSLRCFHGWQWWWRDIGECKHKHNLDAGVFVAYSFVDAHELIRGNFDPSNGGDCFQYLILHFEGFFPGLTWWQLDTKQFKPTALNGLNSCQVGVIWLLCSRSECRYQYRATFRGKWTKLKTSFVPIHASSFQFHWRLYLVSLTDHFRYFPMWSYYHQLSL